MDKFNPRPIDADILAQEESYEFTWPDKRKAILKANSPIVAALRPCREESVNFDKTENLYIEGDNLGGLKLLRETYLGHIRFIYIDPPYNTGHDFLYKDNFSKKRTEFLKQDHQYKKDEKRMVRQSSKNGRFHTDWLNMIYPRLRVARDLMTDDGVIFISIGDGELAQLRMICDEIFGEGNFLALVPRVAKRTSDKGTHFKPTKDYLLCMAKNISLVPEFGIPKGRSEEDYCLIDEDGRRYRKSGASLYQPSLDSRPNQRYYIKAPDGSLIIPPGNVFPEEKEDAAAVKPKSNVDKVWRWSVKSYLKQKDRLIFTKGSAQNPLLDENGRQSKWNIYPKVYLEEDIAATLHPEDIIYNYPNSQAAKELNSLRIPFDFAKPSALIRFLLNLINDKEMTVLDFFAGSSTTAHAVMQLNAEDGGKRKFIMVQIPELCAPDSEAGKMGYINICEIGKERIRRAGRKIIDENPLDRAELDIGFRVLKLDSGN